MFKILAACFILLFPASLRAQAAPSGGQDLLAQPGIDQLKLDGSKGTLEKVPVTGQSFAQAVKLTTLESTTNPWDVQVEAVVSQPVKAGDVVLAEFWMRAAQTSVESGEASSEFVFERLGDPWTKAVSYSLSAGPQWRKFSVPFTIAEDLDAGKSHICFRMGYRPQAFELADFKLTTYGTKVKIADLPQTKLTYEGGEPDAPWRKEAQDRIEKIRKGDLTVTVKDASGNPLAGATVAVRMKRQAYGFGTAVVAQKLATSGGDNDRYQKEVARLFNRVVFENDLKWGPWEEGASNNGYWRREYVEGAMKWLSERHFDVRGHNMVWGSWKWLPADVKQLQGDPKALEDKIENRIKDVGGAMKGQLVEWDVVNEPVPEHQLTDILGKQAMITWYKTARQADPKPLLFVNDYPSPDTTGHLDDYDQTIQYLIQNGAPLGGIGLQGHVGSSPWSIPALFETLDKLGAHGLPVEITEYDTDIKDPQLDAQFLKDFMTAVFSHPSTSGFLMWGFWDAAHWHNKSPIFNQDWTEKPSGLAYEQLVLHDWWTNADGTTDAQGAYAVRGFLGDYEVTVTQGAKSVTVQASLPKAGLQLPVVLK
ncbi:MAG TPA: endo-1,4-beta-xylanase [bacterium]|jgi:endo-1,4-beta-xylanase|nr:endo-1,4-beta-xylanase [bacterium]